MRRYEVGLKPAAGRVRSGGGRRGGVGNSWDAFERFGPESVRGICDMEACDTGACDTAGNCWATAVDVTCADTAVSEQLAKMVRAVSRVIGLSIDVVGRTGIQVAHFIGQN